MVPPPAEHSKYIKRDTLDRMSLKMLLCLACLPLCAQSPEEQAAQLRALLAHSPRLPLERTVLAVQPPSPAWALEMVSSVAVDRAGLIYLLQRGEKADPVLVVDRNGRVLRSWGK